MSATGSCPPKFSYDAIQWHRTIILCSGGLGVVLQEPLGIPYGYNLHVYGMHVKD